MITPCSSAPLLPPLVLYLCLLLAIQFSCFSPGLRPLRTGFSTTKILLEGAPTRVRGLVVWMWLECVDHLKGSKFEVAYDVDSTCCNLDLANGRSFGEFFVNRSMPFSNYGPTLQYCTPGTPYEHYGGFSYGDLDGFPPLLPLKSS